MLRRIHRLSKPIRVLLLILPVFCSLACFVEYMHLEDQNSDFNTAWRNVHWGDTMYVKEMLHEGRINPEDLDWMLVLAAEDSDDEAVKTLLALHVHTACKDDQGHTPLQIAQNKGYWKIIHLLQQAGTKE